MDAQLVAIVEEVIGATDLEEFRHGVLRGVLRAVPSDWASLNDIGSEPGDVRVLLTPEPPPDLFEIFVALREQNPILAYMTATRDGRASRFCDHVTRGELEALELYQRVYRPMGVEFQIAFTLPSDRDRTIAVVLSRRDGEYTDGERDLLNRSRPLLIQAFRAAIEHDRIRSALVRRSPPGELLGPLRGAGLTPREAEAMRLVALGRSNRHIAAELGISDRTVGKHLERSFRKLGVGSRSAASQRAWGLLAREPDPDVAPASSGSAAVDLDGAAAIEPSVDEISA